VRAVSGGAGQPGGVRITIRPGESGAAVADISVVGRNCALSGVLVEAHDNRILLRPKRVEGREVCWEGELFRVTSVGQDRLTIATQSVLGYWQDATLDRQEPGS
jgi:hypothetical protein